MNRDASKEKMQSAKLRNPDVVGMAVLIAGGRENSKLQISNAKLRKADPEASSGWDGGFDWGLGSGQRGADGDK